MMKKIIDVIITYIVVIFAFAAVDALVLPIDYWQLNIKPELLMLAFALFLGTILIYVRKAKKASYYLTWVIMFIIYILLYKIAAGFL